MGRIGVTAAPSGSSRLAGIDAARGLAVLGMFAAHLVPDGERESLADGRSSVLFAVLAGMSLGLLSGGSAPPDAGRGRLRRRVAIRGLLLVLLGLLLWTLDSGIAVILDYYGVFFLLLLPVLFAPRYVLVALALAALTAGTTVLGAAPDSPEYLVGGSPVLWLPSEWLVTGYYPGLLWLGYLGVGLALARTGLDRRGVQWGLAVAGTAVSAIGYGTAAVLGFDASAHSDTAWEAAGAGGLAVAIVGVLSLATRSAVIARLLIPLRAVGGMPLTVYTVQILVIAGVRSATGGDPGPATELLLLVLLAVGALIAAPLWRRHRGRGPLEGVIARVAG